MKKPGKSDPSRPREDGYDYKREFYRSAPAGGDPESAFPGGRRPRAARSALRNGPLHRFRYLLTHTFGKLGLGSTPLSRVSHADLEQEFHDAGFVIRQVVRVSTPLLSDKWVALAEKVMRNVPIPDVSPRQFGAPQGTGRKRTPKLA